MLSLFKRKPKAPTEAETVEAARWNDWVDNQEELWDLIETATMPGADKRRLWSRAIELNDAMFQLDSAMFHAVTATWPTRRRLRTDRSPSRGA